MAQQSILTYDLPGNLTAVNVSSASAPSIATQPQPQLVEDGGQVTFSIVANGPNIAYQWLSNGMPIIGATRDSLLLTNPPLTGSNVFSVILSNTFSAITSTPAALWLDSNGNGIPDWWEMQYFGNLNQTAAGDYDGDGVDNLDEYLEGTNPTNAASFDPRLLIQTSNGGVVVSPALPYYTMGQIVTLTAVPDAGQSFVSWSGPVTGTKSPLSLRMTGNLTVVASFGLSLAAALDNTNLEWTTGGGAPWFGQTAISEDGIGAAQSGPLAGGQQSWLRAVTNLPQPMQIAFWWNVSSQPPDGLTFSVDGTTIASIAGYSVGWQAVQYNLQPGGHTLLWTYTKVSNDNPTGIPYADSGWVDEVALTPIITQANAPLLSIVPTSPNAVMISWPAPSTGFRLQQSASISGANWTSVTNTINTLNGLNQIITIPGGSDLFYRLIYP